MIAETGATPPASRFAGCRVLLIDDSRTIAASVVDWLGAAGCRVEVAASGLAAFAALRRARPEVIFCDITMPGLNGYQVCAQIKRHPDFAALPLALLSAAASPIDRARGRLLGATLHIDKPFQAEHLLAALAQLLPQRLQ